MTDLTPPSGHEPDADEASRALEPGRDQVPLEPATLDPIDDAASATLDGQAIDDASSIDADLVAARLDELTAVRALLAAPLTPPDPSIVDAHVAAALAELSSTAAPIATTSAGPAVVPLESRRRRPAVGRWLAVAAAMAVVALAIPVVRSLSNSSSTSSSTAASVASSDSSAPDAAGTESQQLNTADAQSGASTTTTPSAFSQTTDDLNKSGGDIGAADDPVEMAALVHEHAPDGTDQSTTQTTVGGTAVGPTATTVAPSTSRSAPPACDAVARAHHPGLGSVRYTASATYQTIPVVALVYEVPDPTTITYRLIVARTDTCAVLLDLPYA